MSTATMSDSNLLAKLNSQQAEAVSLHWGPSLVIAGAGSGKTTVLTRRIAYLISELNQDPERVLAVTFTNKAAAEMKHRVENLIGFETTRRTTIGTFHSVCARILRREIEEYETAEGWRWNKNFVIYDETDTLSLVKAAIQKLNLDDKVFVPRTIRYELSAIKNDAISATKYATNAKTYKEQRLSEIYNVYQADLARNNAFDFDDLISIYTELLKTKPEVLARQRAMFHHILVDEFQDTNKSQYDLVNMLAGPTSDKQTASNNWEERSLMVVGDVDQSIYSWRKADFRIILGFQNDYKSAKLIKLEENYRSTSTILEIANSIIVNNTERLEKVLRCNRGKGSKTQCYEAQDEIDEAYFVVEELKRLKARGKSHADSVILYRTNAQSRAIEEVLVRNHLPYTIVGGTRFYERQEIKDIIAYLKLIYNGRDGQAFNRVINVPKRGIGKTTVEKLSDYADNQNICMLDAASSATQIRDLSPKVQKQLMDFANQVYKWQNMSKVVSVSGLLELVLRDILYIERLEEDANAAKDELALGRIENVREFINVAKEFESTADEPNLDSFLTRISLVSDLDAVKADQDTIKLMTLHSAKGLEFSVVFLMGLEEGLFPHSRSLDSPTQMEEERRLMYVGVTRAADLLYLTLARKRMLLTKGASGSGFSSNYTVASRFLKEIDPGLLQGFYPSAPSQPLNSPSSSGSGGFGGFGARSFERGNYSDRSSGSGDFNNGERYGTGSGRSNDRSSNNDDYGNDRYANRGGYENNSKYGGNDYSRGNDRPGYIGNAKQPAAGGSSNGSGSPYAANRSPANGGRAGSNGNTGYGGNGQSQTPPGRAMRPGTTNGDSRFSSNSINIREQDAMRPPSPADNSFERLAVGDQVMHAKFGNGKVVKVIGEQDKQIYDVQFEGGAGKKLLDPKFAKLIKLS